MDCPAGPDTVATWDLLVVIATVCRAVRHDFAGSGELQLFAAKPHCHRCVLRIGRPFRSASQTA